MRNKGYYTTIWIVTCLTSGCFSGLDGADATESSDTGGCAPTASAWPEADTLFHKDGRWLGADAAYSVRLSEGRTLWLFGDTFVAGKTTSRSDATFIRNSVGIQTGDDPEQASLAFHFRDDGAGKPTSFFPEEDGQWRWPLHGIRTGDTLTLFFMRLKPQPDAPLFKFEIVGSEALRIDNPDDDPKLWKMYPLALPQERFGTLLGSSVVKVGEFVYAYNPHPDRREVMLSRWPEDAFARGDVSRIEWYAAGKWAERPAITPTAVFGDAPLEFSVHYDVHLKCFVAIESRGFGATTLAKRTALHPEGPWSERVDIFRPHESDLENAFVYAGKAHPEISTADALTLTYVANSLHESTVLSDNTLYFPRFARYNYASDDAQ